MCDHSATHLAQPASPDASTPRRRRRSGRLVRLTVAVTLGVVAWIPLATIGEVVGAAPVTTCIDLSAYEAGSAPAGSGDLGTEGVDEDLADGEVRTLTGVAGGVLDLRITWTNAHDGVLLDPGATPDFTDLDLAAAAVGGADGVIRYFPMTDGRGTATFEFLWAGTTTAAPIELERVLMGGQRDFAVHPQGVAEFVLRSGGTAGTRVAPGHVDPDVTVTDTNLADGITGLGSTPIIELDTGDFGTANDTAYNEARSSYVSVGAFEDRDWTILDWAGAVGDTLQWDLYGSPVTDPETASPTNTVFHGGLSAYIAGLCFTPPEYDLAVVKTVSATAPGTDQLRYTVTVANQGTVAAGAHTITDVLPEGTAYASDTSGVAAVPATATDVVPGTSRDAVAWTFTDLAAGATRSFDLVVDIVDATQVSFRNDVWITADSGADVDSDPTVHGCADGWDDHDDASVDVDGPGDACDDHDAEIVTLDTHSLGNLVWFDADDSGTIDAGEAPIANVWMELFADDDSDGLPDDLDMNGDLTVDDALATDGTDAAGLYLFDGLAPGTYVVCIPPMEWDVDGPLEGMLSSTGAAATGSVGDLDDNGAHRPDGYVCSGPVVLGDGEPLGEDPSNDAVTPDDRSDLTIDFGFWRPSFDLALRKQLTTGGNSAVVAAGDTVSFTLTVFNQGNVTATDIDLVDYVPAGLTLADNAWTSDGSTARRTLTGVVLEPGETTSVTISFTVNGDSTEMLNLAEIAAARPIDADGATLLDVRGVAFADVDSTPDATNGETATDDEILNGGGDEDDHDIARVALAASGPGGGELPATGGTNGIWYPATVAMIVGALLLVLERQRRLAGV